MIPAGKRTLYELAAERADGSRILLKYCSNRGRRTVLEVAREYGPQLVAMGGSETITFADRSADGATIGTLKIKWTGRTQRDAQWSKLPWVGERS